tara:strand:- start:2874 stop:3587 length:714 start_codon:yes stop_codon:yes gene_type:complete
MSELLERKLKGKLHCPEKCCGMPVMECVCGPECAHCNCHEIQKLQKKVDKMKESENKTFKDYLEESGLQYYTGVKKHGKEYMKKAAKAGREGASQEELGRLKDKYSKAEKNKKTTEVDRMKELAGVSNDFVHEETYDGDDFYNNYGDMWYNEDEIMDEAEYQGRKVKLGKPMRGDVKKFKVYVKDPKTKNVKKVNFGDPNMKIKKSNPARRKSFRARHNCDNPGPRTKARYWSCRKW